MKALAEETWALHSAVDAFLVNWMLDPRFAKVGVRGPVCCLLGQLHEIGMWPLEAGDVSW